MYAVIDFGGEQTKVSKGQYIYAPYMSDKEEGASIEFDNILLMENDGSFEVGEPHVKGAKVTGKVQEHVKGDKVIIFKKKRRKGYRKKNGHRQNYTKVLIEDISK